MNDETMNNGRAWGSYSLAVMVLAGVYGLWLAVVPPGGEFPLNDDWAYAQSVRRLLDIGELRISEWASATVIFQIYWGALFAKLGGGFSFTALRWSTLTMSFAGCLALYDLLRQLDVSAPKALLGGLALAANPIYLYLSYTFMSDVFFFSAMVVSLSFYVRGIKQDAAWALLAGSIFAALAYLSRQLGVALPVAAAIALLAKDRRIRWRQLWLASLIPATVFVGHVLWLRFVHGIPWGLELNTVQNSLKAFLRPTMPLNIVWRLLLGLLYVGLFTLPAMVAVSLSMTVGRERLIRLGKIFGVWLVALGVLAAGIVALTGKPMPYLANVINYEGIGVLSLAGNKTPITPDWVFWLATAAAPLAGAAQGTLWTDALLNARREGAQPARVVFAVSLLMAAFTAVIVAMWDEYLIVFIPAGLYLVLRLGPVKLPGWLFGLGACVAFLAYGLFEMDDHMAWNAARWAAGEQLVAQGAPPDAINGGFEWVGWYEFETALPIAIAHGQRDDLFAWMAVTPDQYTLAFEPLPDYTLRDRFPYQTRLGRSGQIYILQSAVP